MNQKGGSHTVFIFPSCPTPLSFSSPISLTCYPETLTHPRRGFARQRRWRWRSEATVTVVGGGGSGTDYNRTSRGPSVLSCEEEGEWRHGGGRPCMPPVVAGQACDEHRELSSFRPNKHWLQAQEQNRAPTMPRPETLAHNQTQIAQSSPYYRFFSFDWGGWSLILTY